MRTPNLLLPLLATCLLLVACNDSGTPGTATGILSVGITDAKVDEAQAVSLHYTQVTIHGEGVHRVIDVVDPATGLAGRTINLLDYTDGVSVDLFAEELPAGQYSWMRLNVDFDSPETYIELSDGRHPLRCQGCENNGVKLNRSFTIEPDQTTQFVLDFDLRSSITVANPSDPEPTYILRPTVRVVSTAASGAITGTVDSTVISSQGGTVSGNDTGCAVYVFEGPDASLDDIYMPMNEPVPDTQNNPVTTAQVKYDGTDYRFVAGFLPAGTYTAALTCDAVADDPANDDILDFYGAQNVPVVAGETTSISFQ